MSHSKYLIMDNNEGPEDGPFSLDELGEMAKQGSITPEFLIRVDGEDQDWMSIQEDQALADQLFPPRKVPVLKKRTSAPEEASDKSPSAAPKEGASSKSPPKVQEKPPPSNSEDQDRLVDVRDLLAASSGSGTPAGRRAQRRERWQQWAVSLSTPGLILGLLLSAAAFGISERTLLEEAWGDMGSLLRQPVLLLAGLDVLFAALLLLGFSSVFSLVRVRSMAALGFFGFYLYSAGQLDLLAGLTASCLGLFGITLSVRLTAVLLFAAAAICGGGYLLSRTLEGAVIFQILP